MSTNYEKINRNVLAQATETSANKKLSCRTKGATSSNFVINDWVNCACTVMLCGCWNQQRFAISLVSIYKLKTYEI